MSILLGDTHAHVPHAMNKCNCKTNLKINEQGYMAVKLFICCIAVHANIRLAGKLYAH